MEKYQEHIIPNRQFTELITEVLKRGKAFRFQASGCSMAPFIKDSDILTLVAINHRQIRPGIVLAFFHPKNNKLTIHRVVTRHRKTYLMKPDNGMDADGWINLEKVIGMVRSVERGGTMIKFGLGWEKAWIAHLSRWNALLPTIGVLWQFFPTWLKRRIKGQ